MIGRRIVPCLAGIIALGALSPGLSYAQDQEAPPRVCAKDPRFGAFDFWIGSWDVHDAASGEQAGTNRIEKVEYDCLITERWTSAQGGTGFSINYFNPVTGVWRQVWISNGYSIDYAGGLNEVGAMRLEGSIYSYSRGSSAPFRGTWTPNEDGSVRQLFELYDKEKETWGVWFDGQYRRQLTD